MGRLGCWLVVWACLGLFSPPPATTAATALTQPDLMERLWKEQGLQQLIHLVEVAAANRQRGRCTSKPAANEKGVYPPERPPCLAEFALQRPPRLHSFRAYVEKAISYTPPGFGTKRAQALGGTFPYLSTALFRAACDNMAAGSGTTSRSADPYFVGNFSNRSLIYCRLPQDDRALRFRLMRGPVPQYFFLVAHRTNSAPYPWWILEHPRVLKVFGQHHGLSQKHPKLVHLSAGVADHISPPALHVIRMQAARQALDVTPTRLLLAPADFHPTPPQAALRSALLPRFPDLPLGWQPGQAVRVEIARSKFIALAHLPDSAEAAQVHALGRVPVVQAPCDEAQQQLPCLTVDSWAALTPRLLEEEWERRMRNPERRYNLDRLWAPWWLAFLLRECLQVP